MLIQAIIDAKKYAHLGLLTIIFVVGCSTTTTVKPTTDLFADKYFPNYKHYPIESPAEIFDLNQSAIAFVDQATLGKYTEKEKLTALINAIFDRSNLSLEYLAQANTSASQTFEAGSANCLSLTIMVYSMTQYLGLDSEFKKVEIPKYWTRRGGNTLLNGHINLVVTPEYSNRNGKLGSRPITIDFDPNQEKGSFKTHSLTKRQIVSLFYANKAAEAMISGKSNDLAYAYLKASLAQYKQNNAAWINLGVLYSRNNMIDEAESTYLSLTDTKKNDTTALTNLAYLYRKTGRVEQAKNIEQTLKVIRIANPYYHKMLGDKAFDEEQYQLAIKYYKTSVALNRKPHEFHYSLAQAYLAVGDIENTKRYLRSAKTYANDEELEQNYESKLSSLANHHAS